MRAASIGSRAALATAFGLLMLVPSYSPGAEGPSCRLSGADVRIVVPVKPGGAFEAKTTVAQRHADAGHVQPVLLRGEVSVDLATIDTGIGLRNQHLREKYLEISRGRGFDHAVLSEIRLDQADGEGLPGEDDLRGQAAAARREPGRGGDGRDPPGGPGDASRGELPADPHRLRDRAARVSGRGGREQAPRQGPLHRHARTRQVRRGRSFFVAALGLTVGVSDAAAEPIFLSRQYTRCTNCHYSPTGGGLLTPYGRSLSREELSTFGASHGTASPSREQDFLFGALGKGLGPVSVGLELLPAHLSVDAAGYSSSRDFLMNAALAAALQYRKWTFYGQVGRQPRGDDDARHLVRALGHVPVGRGRGGPCRPLPARLRCPARRPHRVHSRDARLRQQRPDLRSRAELQERPPPGAGGRGSRACRVPRERRRAGCLHRHRALAVRPASAHGAGGVRGLPGCFRHRSEGGSTGPRPGDRA